MTELHKVGPHKNVSNVSQCNAKKFNLSTLLNSITEKEYHKSMPDTFSSYEAYWNVIAVAHNAINREPFSQATDVIGNAPFGQRGVCFGVATAWLLSSLRGTQFNHDVNSGFCKEIAMQIALAQTPFGGNAARSCVEDYLKMATGRNPRLSIKSPLKGDIASAIAKSINKNSGVAIIGIKKKDSSSGHVISIDTRQTVSQFAIFDPNLGSASFSSKNDLAQFTKQLIENVYPEYMLGDAFALWCKY